ncbi:hypothetical protein JAAARDRAFT_40239 [Jaapia argillacea MUCL 33604]|uniref:Uncharacterized protein n=1 Tax=Jaapia argillacea MUCL 33604 TaxID=933084 RepID=A0A067PPV3_9AGAM|nr:hypothetical protein JAAARDRAFT_40239 [Jaapia argillacea MUCL 33604]
MLLFRQQSQFAFAAQISTTAVTGSFTDLTKLFDPRNAESTLSSAARALVSLQFTPPHNKIQYRGKPYCYELGF